MQILWIHPQIYVGKTFENKWKLYLILGFQAKQDEYIIDPRKLNLLQKFCQSTNTFGWSINTFGQK